MYNLIKMELYRLFKSKSAWIVLAFSVLFLLLNVVFTNSDLQTMKEEARELSSASDINSYNNSEEKVRENGVQVDENSVQMNVGIYFDTNYDWIDNEINILEFFITVVRSGGILLFLTFFTAMFVNGENKYGFVKNIAGRMPFKGYLFLAKLAAIFVFNVMIFMAYYLFSIPFVRLIIGGIDLSIGKAALKAVLLQLILHFAFSCVVAMLASVSKSTAFSATVGTVFCCGVGSWLWILINMIINKLKISDSFSVNDYTLVYNIQNIDMSFDFKNTLRIVAVAVLFVAASSIISVIVLNRRDVK